MNSEFDEVFPIALRIFCVRAVGSVAASECEFESAIILLNNVTCLSEYSSSKFASPKAFRRIRLYLYATKIILHFLKIEGIKSTNVKQQS